MFEQSQFLQKVQFTFSSLLVYYTLYLYTTFSEVQCSSSKFDFSCQTKLKYPSLEIQLFFLSCPFALSHVWIWWQFHTTNGTKIKVFMQHYTLKGSSFTAFLNSLFTILVYSDSGQARAAQKGQATVSVWFPHYVLFNWRLMVAI